MTYPPRPWHFLVNPAAGSGRAGRRWAKWSRYLLAELPHATWAESTAETGMAALARAAVEAGHRYLVGVGGDGTHHDIINGVAAAGQLGAVTYAPLPLGSGNDWVRTLHTPRQRRAWAAMLQAEQTIDHRIGRLDWDGGGCYFLNVAGLAYDAAVVRHMDGGRFRHRLMYPLVTLAYLGAFTAPVVRIDYDGRSLTGPVHTVNLGIGRYNGGGMRLVPHASPTADSLALTIAEELPLIKVLRESWRFYTGSIGKVKGVTLTTASAVTITPLRGRLELEADGEWLAEGPVRASLTNDTLRVVVQNPNGVS